MSETYTIHMWSEGSGPESMIPDAWWLLGDCPKCEAADDPKGAAAIPFYGYCAYEYGPKTGDEFSCLRCGTTFVAVGDGDAEYYPKDDPARMEIEVREVPVAGKPINEPEPANVLMIDRPREYRRALLQISPADLTALLTPGIRAIAVDGAPPDAVPLATHYDFHRDSFYVVLEHPSFDAVPEGCMSPILDARLLFELTEYNFWCPACGADVVYGPPPFSWWCHCGERFGIEPVGDPERKRWRHVPVIDLATPKPEES